MKILGVSAFYHDSAAALIEDGQIIAAAQEERELRCAEVIAILVRAVHGLQHQLYELGAQSTVVRRMLLTGTGSRLHTDMVELVRACSLEALPSSARLRTPWQIAASLKKLKAR